MVEQGALRVTNLRVENRLSEGGGMFALGPIDFTLAAGEIMAIVGDSGAGKSLLVDTLIRSLRPSAAVVSGEVLLHGKDLVAMQDRELDQVRGKSLAYIGANPHNLLHPMITVGKQVSSILRSHRKLTRAQAKERVVEMFTDVGIPDPERRYHAYPHELSGGMAQRIVLSIGLIGEADVIVTDEPTAGLDVTIQAQVLEQMNTLIRGDRKRSLLIATRDLGIVANFCDSVLILGAGQQSEYGPVEEFFGRPRSEAGKQLLMASTEI